MNYCNTNQQITPRSQKSSHYDESNCIFDKYLISQCSRLLGLIVCICIGLLAIPVNAEQVLYKKVKKQSQLNFKYQWLDSFSQNQALEFNLPIKQSVRQIHKRFVAELAQQYVFIELHKAARLIDPREARISIQRGTQDIKVNVISRSETTLEKWQASVAHTEVTAFDKYLQDNYYARFTSYLGQEAVKADHLRYISENKAPLLPVAQAIYETLAVNSESRIYVNLLLSWVQSIPYNELEDRMSSNGAGYLPPLAIIRQNQGDCDSKSVLMASLIRSLLPDVKLVMIYLPQHALLGISLPTRSNEQTFKFDGSDYLLMEPTGPAVMPLGSIATTTSSAINSGLISYEKIP
jgi:hypothetical protein